MKALLRALHDGDCSQFISVLTNFKNTSQSIYIGIDNEKSIATSENEYCSFSDKYHKNVYKLSE